MIWNGCPIRYSAGILGDKWSLLLIRDLALKNKHFYGEFLDDDERISSNILADRLAKLVEHGIVTKSPDINHGKKFVYVLTQKGIDLVPVLVEMLKWAHRYDDETFLTEKFINTLNKSPTKYKNETLKRLKASNAVVLSKTEH